jgi:hypothetical protein
MEYTVDTVPLNLLERDLSDVLCQIYSTPPDVPSFGHGGHTFSVDTPTTWRSELEAVAEMRELSQSSLKVETQDCRPGQEDVLETTETENVDCDSESGGRYLC